MLANFGALHVYLLDPAHVVSLLIVSPVWRQEHQVIPGDDANQHQALYNLCHQTKSGLVLHTLLALGQALQGRSC